MGLISALSPTAPEKEKSVCPFGQHAHKNKRISEYDFSDMDEGDLTLDNERVQQFVIDFVKHKDGINSYAIGLPMPKVAHPITYQQFAVHYQFVTGFFADCCCLAQILFALQKNDTKNLGPNSVSLQFAIELMRKAGIGFELFNKQKSAIQTDCIEAQRHAGAKKGRDLEMYTLNTNGREPDRGHTFYKGPWYTPSHPRYNSTPALVMVRGNAFADHPGTDTMRDGIGERIRESVQDYVASLPPETQEAERDRFQGLVNSGYFSRYAAECLVAIPPHLDIFKIQQLLQKNGDKIKNNIFHIDNYHSLECNINGDKLHITIFDSRNSQNNGCVFNKVYSIPSLLEDLSLEELAPGICSGIYGKLYSQGIYINALKGNKILFNELNGYIQAGIKK